MFCEVFFYLLYTGRLLISVLREGTCEMRGFVASQRAARCAGGVRHEGAPLPVPQAGLRRAAPLQLELHRRTGLAGWW